MNQTPHPLPLIARQHLVEQVLERLQRPDDVRDSPKRFIQPGFYGLGGVGKSRLLAEIEQRAKEVTPYVVSINFDRRHAAVVPGSPLALVQHLIAALADIDRQMCRPWQRWRWSSVNPFRECLDITGEMGEPSIIQSVVAREGSQVSDVTMTIEDRYAAVPPNLQQAFAQAFPDLCVKSKVRREYGAVGKPKPRPLVVILLDTLEAASKSLRAWLPNNLAALFSANTLGYHAVIVAAGRQQVPGLTDTPLPPFSPAEAVTFLRQYIVHRQNAGDTRYGSTVTQHNLREDTPVQRQVIELAEGVPLLLQLLADLAAAAPGKSLGLPTDTVPAAVEARITYVIEHYLKRMKAEAEAQGDAALWQRYWLLSCGAIARRIPSGGLLQALLQDLPGTPFDVRSNYDSLFQRLGQEAFVQIGPSDDLIYHELVREGFLAALRREDVQRWQELHRRAAGWFQAQGEETEALYHGVQRDYVGTMQTLRQRIEAALQAQAWQEAQGLIGTTTEIVLEADDWAWMMLYKAELAWGEDNQALAQQRLHRLIGQELPADLQERMAARLETWFGFNETMDAEEAAEKHSQRLHILLWWASRRSLKGVQAHALRGLGQVALRQTRYVDAQNHFAAALEMYKAIEDRRGQAQALHGLGDMAGMQARYVDAQNHYAAALVMYKAIAYRPGQAQALLGLGEVARMQDRYADAQNHYAAALAVFEAIAYRPGQARALLGLAEVAMMQARYADAQNHYAAALVMYKAI
ncbi:MAG: tetratricopeptide repeat protein, partial [Ardenticatenia bacterium]|nr:tetratricopeptide repeat protein [Ardenticatenia bacterium]